MRPPESARFSRSASSSISPPIRARNSESRSNQYVLSWPGLNFCQRACPRHNNNSIATSWPSRPPIEIEILSSRPPAVHLEATFGLPRSTNSEIRLKRSEEHTSELQSLRHLVCRLLLEKKKKQHPPGQSDKQRHGNGITGTHPHTI